MEEKEGGWAVSIGRTSWWMAFLLAIIIWITAQSGCSSSVTDISANHFNILIALATYNFGTKAASTVKKIWAKKDQENDGPG